MHFESVPFLRLAPVRQEVKDVIGDVLNSGVFMNGHYLSRFQDAFSDYLNLNYLIPTANCTDSLEIILRSCNIQKGDEVITSSFSWFSDASVIQLLDAKPVFCELDVNHFGIQFSDLEKRITSNTKAVLLPHLFGLVHPDIEKIAALCLERGLVLIEDCAQAHGATLKGKKAGTFGNIAAFSFYPTKNLAALGDAGAIATNDRALARKCRQWAHHGQVERNEHVQMGRNSRMDEIQAAILSIELPFLNSDNEKRKRLAAIYFNLLQDLDYILPMRNDGHVYHQFVIRTDRRDELQSYLSRKGIETDIHYPVALSDMSVFNSNEKYPNARAVSKRVLSLPIHPNHVEEEIEYVAKSVNQFFKT